MSRCQRFDFRRISQVDITSKLTHICSTEGINIEPEGLRLIAKSATGSMRDAENLLEQITTYYGSDIELHQVQTILGISGDWRAKEIVKHIIHNDISAGIATINSVNNDGLDLSQFNRELVEYLRGLLLVKSASDEAIDFTAEDIAELKDLAAQAPLAQILKAVKLFGQLELGFDNFSTLPLELALVECTLSLEEKSESPARRSESESHQPPKTATPPTTPTQSKQPASKPQPTEVPTPTTSDTTTPPEPGSELEQLKLNWKQIIEQAPEDTKKTAAIAILRSAGVRPVAAENETVVLAFRYPYHKEQIEKTENQQVAERIISSFLGNPWHVCCIYETEDDHMVKAALKMGAQIIDVEEK